ncbi:four-carbon acid sugar kinase family protein [Nonomuraea sp. B12E4]|uniref:four-carbon acid sugar kinase family protein n=1 Tax=Nonomuraea sp. B12E4 TaxID=3153564 RepID=UPI00325E6813
MGGIRVFALADDLSGAAEVAAVLMSPERPARITLSASSPGPEPVHVTDLDCRHHPQTFDLVREALGHAAGRHVFVKIDSLLRGNVPATVSAAAVTAAAAVPGAAAATAAADSRAAATTAVASAAVVVLAPALPSAGRTVVGGVPYVRGVRLRETRAWHAEPGPALAPASVTDLLDGTPWFPVPLAVIRAGHQALSDALGAAGNRVAVCDTETDADLDAIVAATLRGAGGGSACFIGAGGLAAALGRALDGAASSPAAAPATDPGTTPPTTGPPTTGPAAITPVPPCPDPSLLIVVGTAAPAAIEQVELLLDHGTIPVTLDATDLATTPPPPTAARRVRQALATGPAAVLTIKGAAPPALVAARLAGIVREALHGPAPGPTSDLVLTGGETARRVLEALDVRELIPVAQIHHGAVHSRTPQGRSVVTRPGSFGEPDSLLRIAAHLKPHRFPAEQAPADPRKRRIEGTK